MWQHESAADWLDHWPPRPSGSTLGRTTSSRRNQKDPAGTFPRSSNAPWSSCVDCQPCCGGPPPWELSGVPFIWCPNLDFPFCRLSSSALAVKNRCAGCVLALQTSSSDSEQKGTWHLSREIWLSQGTGSALHCSPAAISVIAPFDRSEAGRTCFCSTCSTPWSPTRGVAGKVDHQGSDLESLPRFSLGSRAILRRASQASSKVQNGPGLTRTPPRSVATSSGAMPAGFTTTVNSSLTSRTTYEINACSLPL